MVEHPVDAPAGTPLRRGWTTGACAAAAAGAAAAALFRGEHLAAVTLTLPGGQQPCFAVAHEAVGADWAEAGVIKDAGDDPDVTHGALVIARVRRAAAGSGLVFRAGDGVGTVTRPGLPMPPGEPAINPMPRRMIAAAVAMAGAPADLEVTIAIPGGAKLAERTLNARLGIQGGLSVLGTTGIVIPYSCAAWIDTIHRGIDVARASGLAHIAASTGSTSERAVQSLYGLPEAALIEMGDFVGGTLKYLRRHPVARLTLAGGFAKMAKLGQGLMDLHSKRGQVDLGWLATRAREAGASADQAATVARCATAAEALGLLAEAAVAVGDSVARSAQAAAAIALVGSSVAVEVLIFDREGVLIGRSG